MSMSNPLIWTKHRNMHGLKEEKAKVLKFKIKLEIQQF